MIDVDQREVETIARVTAVLDGGGGDEALARFAVTYAAGGLEVFPVNPRTKQPFDAANSQKHASTDPAVVAGWWQRWPDALIGRRLPADRVILDIDPRHRGDTAWEALDDEFGPIPVGRMHYSGRGDDGFHAEFLRPEGLPRISAKRLHVWAQEHEVGAPVLDKKTGKVKRWTSGIDLLHRDWRYTILPPSPHPATGKPYRWREVNGAVGPLLAPVAELLVPLAGVADDEEDEDPDESTEGEARPPSVLLNALEHSDSPADWFSATRTWREILGPHGWTLAQGDGDSDGALWRHPDADPAHEHSASVRHGCLFVYTPNTVFEETEEGDPHGYTRFRAWAELEHGGDLSAAAGAARALKTAPGPNVGGAPSADPPKQQPRTIIRTADQFDGRPVPQLIRGWFPRAEVCIVAGKPNAGKGVVLADIIARGTRGDLMPNGDRIIRPFTSAVICLPGEDSASEWSRRLTVARALLDRVMLVEKTVDDAGIEHAVDMGSVADVVEDLARDGADLIVADSLTGLSNSQGFDTNKGEVRAVLDTLSALARTYGVTIVLIHHTRKAQGDPLDILQGNTQIGAASRSVLVAVEERVDDGAEPDVRLFGVAKLNGSKRSAPVGFRTVGAWLSHPDGEPMRDDRGDVAYIPRVEWVKDRTFTQGQLIAASNGTVLRSQGRDQAAVDILSAGPIRSTDYIEAMGDAGFSKDQALRARDRVGKAIRHEGRWWSYPVSMAPDVAKRAIIALAEAEAETSE